jgi:hypothetical protein
MATRAGNLQDMVTRSLDVALRILVLDHPLRTSLGILAGVSLDALLRFLAPWLSKALPILDVARISTLHCVAVGVLLFNVPVVILLFRRKRRLLSERVEEAFKVVSEARKLGMPADDAAACYRTICQNVLDAMQPGKKELLPTVDPPIAEPSRAPDSGS